MLHIYQICEEYFRYDVTTNVAIGLPDPVQFPSLTLCVDLVESLKWEKMPSELIRRLLTFTQETFFNETVVSDLINNRKKIRDEIRRFQENNSDQNPSIYNNLVKEKTVAEILKLSETFEEIFGYFTTTGRVYEDTDSENLTMTVYRLSNASDFQFSLDMVFVHDCNKCFTINIRPNLNKFTFKELSATWTDTMHCNLMSWISDFGSDVAVKLHAKGYFIGADDVMFSISPLTYATTTFVTHESILLEYPYKTNCIDYTKIGFLSQKHCYEMCFKAKTVDKWKSIIPESHAFETDMIPLREEGPSSNKSDIRTTFASRTCRIECGNRDCQSVTFLVDDKGTETNGSLIDMKTTYVMTVNPQSLDVPEEFFQLIERAPDNLCGQEICPGDKVVTRTETQACISLISFLTSAFSTFGFWLGWSVSSLIHFVKESWANIMNRQRFQDSMQIHRQFNLLSQQLNLINQRLNCLKRRQSIVMLQQRSNSNVRHRLNTQNRVHVSTGHTRN